jgi:hypothetical protein
MRHAAPNQPFGATSIEAKLVEDRIGLVDTVRVGSVIQHRQRLSSAGAPLELLPVEKFDHNLVRRCCAVEPNLAQTTLAIFSTVSKSKRRRRCGEVPEMLWVIRRGAHRRPERLGVRGKIVARA